MIATDEEKSSASTVGPLLLAKAVQNWSAGASEKG
jgi:hypothetical protein